MHVQLINVCFLDHWPAHRWRDLLQNILWN